MRDAVMIGLGVLACVVGEVVCVAIALRVFPDARRALPPGDAS